MKKILNVILICSIFTLSTTPTFAKGWFKKDKTEKETKEKVEIVKPEKEKTNLKHEIKIGRMSSKEVKKYLAGHLGYLKIANTKNLELKLFEQ